jgi:hypothetical protein
MVDCSESLSCSFAYYDECELDRTVPEAYQEDECNGPFEVYIGMALDKLDGDTGDIKVSEVRSKKRLWQNQPELHRLKYASPLSRASTYFKRCNPLTCRVTS